MTEQEAKAIKLMKNVRDDAVVTLNLISNNELNVSPMLYAGRKEKAEVILNAFEELEQYRELGTVEEIKKKIRKELPYMSIAQAKFKSELNSYRALGTLEELRGAREKQVPKKPEYKILKSLPTCPNCGEVNLVQENEYGNVICNNKFCPDCGQTIDWSDAE